MKYQFNSIVDTVTNKQQTTLYTMRGTNFNYIVILLVWTLMNTKKTVEHSIIGNIKTYIKRISFLSGFILKYVQSQRVLSRHLRLFALTE